MRTSAVTISFWKTLSGPSLLLLTFIGGDEMGRSKKRRETYDELMALLFEPGRNAEAVFGGTQESRLFGC